MSFTVVSSPYPEHAIDGTRGEHHDRDQGGVRGTVALARLAAGLVDRVQVTLFPVITGQTGLDPIFQGAADFDLELIERRTSAP